MPPRRRDRLQRHTGNRLRRVAVIEEAATGTKPGASLGDPQRSEELGSNKPDFSPSIIRPQPFIRPLVTAAISTASCLPRDFTTDRP